MDCRSIIPNGWSNANTVENQCHLIDAMCAETVTCKIKKLCKRLDLSEEEGWSLYGLETIKQVLEQGILWDHLFFALFAMDLEYRKDVTKHERNKT